MPLVSMKQTSRMRNGNSCTPCFLSPRGHRGAVARTRAREVRARYTGGGDSNRLCGEDSHLLLAAALSMRSLVLCVVYETREAKSARKGLTKVATRGLAFSVVVSTEHAYAEILTPSHVVLMLEDLHKEGRLSRRKRPRSRTRSWPRRLLRAPGPRGSVARTWGFLISGNISCHSGQLLVLMGAWVLY